MYICKIGRQTGAVNVQGWIFYLGRGGVVEKGRLLVIHATPLLRIQIYPFGHAPQHTMYLLLILVAEEKKKLATNTTLKRIQIYNVRNYYYYLRVSKKVLYSFW